jgi:hypothetical protein
VVNVDLHHYFSAYTLLVKGKEDNFRNSLFILFEYLYIRLNGLARQRLTNQTPHIPEKAFNRKFNRPREGNIETLKLIKV